VMMKSERRWMRKPQEGEKRDEETGKGREN
jgi:hypothetical protein